jgi:hypothetical protein
MLRWMIMCGVFVVLPLIFLKSEGINPPEVDTENQDKNEVSSTESESQASDTSKPEGDSEGGFYCNSCPVPTEQKMCGKPDFAKITVEVKGISTVKISETEVILAGGVIKLRLKRVK